MRHNSVERGRHAEHTLRREMVREGRTAFDWFDFGTAEFTRRPFVRTVQKQNGIRVAYHFREVGCELMTGEHLHVVGC